MAVLHYGLCRHSKRDGGGRAAAIRSMVPPPDDSIVLANKRSAPPDGVCSLCHDEAWWRASLRRRLAGREAAVQACAAEVSRLVDVEVIRKRLYRMLDELHV